VAVPFRYYSFTPAIIAGIEKFGEFLLVQKGWDGKVKLLPAKQEVSLLN
jgi:hypothetical protein